VKQERQREQRRDRRRIEPAFIVSLALHLLLGAAAVHVIVDPRRFGIDWRPATAPKPEGERMSWIATHADAPEVPIPGAAAGRLDGDNRAAGEPTVIPPPPLTTPTQLPPGAGAGVPPAAGAGGTGAAGGGGAPGAATPRPAYTDMRIWDAPPVTPIPQTHTEELRGDLQRALRAHNDSMAIVAGMRRPEDWTFERGGQKWGMDPSNIYLGPIKLPTILLALIPVSAQQNPNRLEYERRIGSMAAEVRERGPIEVDFRDEVKRIRERVERERAARRDSLRARPPSGG
jgi:hypothetical protein